MHFKNVSARPITVLATATLLLAFSTSCLAKLPHGLAGTWQVTEVHVNTQSSRTALYGWNDPALRWRLFTFSDAEVTDDTPESAPCHAPDAEVSRSKLAPLIAGSMGGSANADGGVVRATPAGYGFRNPPTQTPDVIRLTCSGKPWHGGPGADGGLQGAWMYLAPNGHLVLRWYDETLLVLDRLPVQAKPEASFDCAKAASSTEKTLCDSLELAAFDRSVASAYRIALDEVRDDPDMTRQLLATQRAWLRERNACGSDTACLLKTMKTRITALAGFGND